VQSTPEAPTSFRSANHYALHSGDPQGRLTPSAGSPKFPSRPNFVARKKGLDIFPYGHILVPMARAATTSDAFNAVAEPRRRDILNYLAMQERSVNEIVDAMAMEQPSVSKHLKVLKGVGLVEVRREGRQMLYKVNATAIRPLHEWTGTFERLWKHQLSRVKERAEAANAQSNAFVEFQTRRKS